MRTEASPLALVVASWVAAAPIATPSIGLASSEVTRILNANAWGGGSPKTFEQPSEAVSTASVKTVVDRGRRMGTSRPRLQAPGPARLEAARNRFLSAVILKADVRAHAEGIHAEPTKPAERGRGRTRMRATGTRGLWAGDGSCAGPRFHRLRASVIDVERPSRIGGRGPHDLQTSPHDASTSLGEVGSDSAPYADACIVYASVSWALCQDSSLADPDASIRRDACATYRDI